MIDVALACSCCFLWFYGQFLDKATVNGVHGTVDLHAPSDPGGVLGADSKRNPLKNRRLCSKNEITERMMVGPLTMDLRPPRVLALFRFQTGFLVAVKSDYCQMDSCGLSDLENLGCWDFCLPACLSILRGQREIEKNCRGNEMCQAQGLFYSQTSPGAGEQVAHHLQVSAHLPTRASPTADLN